MVVSPLTLCNNILTRAFDEEIPVSPMKLQKLMYFVCKAYVQTTGQELIPERFGVWQYGPVLRTVYDEFKSFGSRSISEYAKDAQGQSLMVNEECAPQLAGIINSVWDHYKRRTGIQLSKITHEDGSGWSRAYERGCALISKEDMINDTTS